MRDPEPDTAIRRGIERVVVAGSSSLKNTHDVVFLVVKSSTFLKELWRPRLSCVGGGGQLTQPPPLSCNRSLEKASARLCHLLHFCICIFGIIIYLHLHLHYLQRRRGASCVCVPTCRYLLAVRVHHYL